MLARAIAVALVFGQVGCGASALSSASANGGTGMPPAGGAGPTGGASGAGGAPAADDSGPLTLLSFTPVDGATDVPRGSTVTATFSRPVSLTSLGAATFAINDGDVPVAGQFTTVGNTAVFTPALPLGPMQTYTVTVAPGVLDLAGHALVTGATWSFRSEEGAWDASPTQLSHPDVRLMLGGAIGSGRGPGAETWAIWPETNVLATMGAIFAAESNVQSQASSPEAAAGWTDPAHLDTDAAAAAILAPVVVDPAGNATALWQAESGAIRVAHFEPTTGWSEPQDLDGNGQGGQLVVDAAGNVTAAWYSLSSASPAAVTLVACRFTPAEGWGSVVTVQPIHVLSSPLALAADPAGNVTLVWPDTIGAIQVASMWAQRFAPDSGWGTAQLIETDDIGDAAFPSACADPAGNVIAGWHQSNGSNPQAIVNRFVPGAGWGTAQRIDMPDNVWAQYVRVAVDANGDAVATWVQTDTVVQQIAASRFTPGSGWSAPDILRDSSQSLTGSNGRPFNLDDPQVVVDAPGNAVVAWPALSYDQNGMAVSAVGAARFTPVSGWSPAIVVPGTSELDGLSVDAFGRVTALVVSASGSAATIDAVRFQ